VVESTYNWYWLVDGPQDAGFYTHLQLHYSALNYFVQTWQA
jgi:hypothetical protein